MKVEAIKRKMGRPAKAEQENEGQVVPTYFGKKTTEFIGDQMGESYKQVERYIRLNELTPQLQQMVDDKKIAMTPAVELSYLKPLTVRVSRRRTINIYLSLRI